MDCPASNIVLSVPSYYPQIVQQLHEPADYRVQPPGPGHQDGEAVLDLCLRRTSDSLHAPPPQPVSTPTPPLSPLLTSFSPILGAHNKGCKPTRPFKAYPKDPLSMAATETLLGHGSSDAYLEFRRRMLEQLQQSSTSSQLSKPPRPPTSPLQQPSSTDPALSADEAKTAAYWEKRRKNNEAAKRSRDARRAKEDELAIRAAFLEQENLKLKYEVTALRTETSKLRYLLFNNNNR